jgi:hypothetical protein
MRPGFERLVCQLKRGLETIHRMFASRSGFCYASCLCAATLLVVVCPVLSKWLQAWHFD